jgi:Flp pilus assembly protein TadD
MLKAASCALALLMLSTTALAQECLHGTRLVDLDAAVASCTQLIRREPTNVEAYMERGHLYVLAAMVTNKIDNYKRAIEDFTRAISLAPNDPNPYHHRGLAYEDLKDVERAIGDFRQMLDLIDKHPRATDGWRNMAIDALKRLKAYR